MAKKFLTPIDLSQLELQNARIQNLASVPSSPVKGQIYFNTTTNKAMVYNGTTWVPWEADTNTITGVKGNSETNYRTGNVNITAANVGAAPTQHVATNNTYGLGTDTYFGHVKLSDSISSTSSTSAGIAATPKAVKDAKDAAEAYSDELEEALGAAAFKGVDTSISTGSGSTNLPTTGAVTSYVSSAISASDAMIFKGGIAGTSSSPGAYTPAADCGHTYRVTTGGYIDGIKVEAGDILICNADGTAAATGSNYTTIRDNWTFVQANIDGVITSISGTSPISVTGSGASRTVEVGDASTSAKGVVQLSSATNSTSTSLAATASAVKAAYDLAASKTSNTGTVTSVASGTGLTGGPITTSGTLSLASVHTTAPGAKGDTANQTPGFGGTFNVTSGTVDAYGRTTAFSSHTVKIPNALASTSAPGLMGTGDKATVDKLGNVFGETDDSTINYRTATISVGSSSVTSPYGILRLLSYNAWQGAEEVVLDVSLDSNNKVVFGTAANVTAAVTIHYWVIEE